MLFRPSMMRELDGIEDLKIGRLVTSVWQGYLDDERNRAMLDWLESRSITRDHCHTSGHADVVVLQDLRKAFTEAVAVPIHTGKSELHARLFGPSQGLGDGQWLSVNHGRGR